MAIDQMGRGVRSRSQTHVVPIESPDAAYLEKSVSRLESRAAIVGHAQLVVQEIDKCRLEYSGQQRNRDRSPYHDDRQGSLGLRSDAG